MTVVGRLLTLLPALPSVMAAVAYEQARLNQSFTGFRTDQEAMVSGPLAPGPAAERESRDAA
ncbi:hypothetical protein OG241_08780 [Streptomyces sp. NBC_01390]|uniref:hypothetical protein n=1 Tax=Streptomyces sp. NBC_01390 TaxID=2903850 RepID=UPI003243CF6B